MKSTKVEDWINMKEEREHTMMAPKFANVNACVLVSFNITWN